ncbi:MAG: hypothetical protein JWO67_6325 [Streptosporangiaceae bacterium]|jgi:hypothetical protein|nr:hypothetical protein [Streptosporangiaceae bacterium]
MGKGFFNSSAAADHAWTGWIAWQLDETVRCRRAMLRAGLQR